jgi:hypothetical protein
MNPPIEFEILDGYARFRASGEATFHETVGLVARAISEASDQGIKRLLVDILELRGFPHPTTSERFFMAEKWASNARGLRLVVVAREDLIDPLRFGVTVARNRGLFANVFATEAEAVEWLLHPDPA